MAGIEQRFKADSHAAELAFPISETNLGSVFP
jgi:hypothetical protein